MYFLRFSAGPAADCPLRCGIISPPSLCSVLNTQCIGRGREKVWASRVDRYRGKILGYCTICCCLLPASCAVNWPEGR